MECCHRCYGTYLVVDDLLSELQIGGFHAQGYADDITIMVCGKFEVVVSARKQVALRLVERWCKKGLNVNSKKMTTSPFAGSLPNSSA